VAGHAEAPPESYRVVKAEPVLAGTPLPSWGGARRGKRAAQAFGTSCAPYMLQHWHSSAVTVIRIEKGSFLQNLCQRELHDIASTMPVLQRRWH
jgi:hypothetical protein